MQAIPSGNPRQRRASVPLAGETPSPMAVRPGCAFASRCPYAFDACRQAVPALERVVAASTGAQPHVVACIRRDEIAALASTAD
jgi:oligopeptide/dipeptide ABC transporter ATP-binding protein